MTAPATTEATRQLDQRLEFLAQAAMEGDNGAVAEIVRLTEHLVRRVCVALGSGSDVDDLVQDTYLRALRALPTFRSEAPLRTWLLTIARRVCADAVRARRRLRRLDQRLQSERHILPPNDSAVAELLSELTDDRRDAFVLTQVAGLSYEDAAAIVGCPIGTIRSRVARARADLAERVQRAEAI